MNLKNSPKIQQILNEAVKNTNRNYEIGEVSGFTGKLFLKLKKVNNKINRISSNEKVIIYGAGEHTSFLFKYTNINKKNIIGIVDMREDMSVFQIRNSFNKLVNICVEKPNLELLNKADAIVISSYESQESINEYLETNTVKAKIIKLYDDLDDSPFYSICEFTDVYVNMIDESSKLPFRNFVIKKANEFQLEILDRFKKVNDKISNIQSDKKVIICGAGEHTNKIFEYTNINTKKVIGIVDETINVYKRFPVKKINKENLEIADVIIISSFDKENNIYSYLKGLNLKAEIIKLYDSIDKVPFYQYFNYFAPNLHGEIKKENKYNMEEIIMHLEEKNFELSNKSDYYVNYNIKSKKINNYYFYNDKENNKYNSEISIILQGPIVYKDNFTYETILWYRMIYPYTNIILSTWKEELNNEQFKSFFDLDIEIVLTDKSKDGGLGNVNYQLISTYEGLKRAKCKKTKYAMKTRTDFRFYSINMLNMLYTLTNTFKLKRSNEKQSERLVILPPPDSAIRIFYFLPDFLMFGNIDDMLNFWNGEILFTESINTNAEILLFERYAKFTKNYIRDDQQFKEYKNMVYNNYIIIDPSFLDFILYKYKNLQLYSCETQMNFSDWFCMQIKNICKETNE